MLLDKQDGPLITGLKLRGMSRRVEHGVKPINYKEKSCSCCKKVFKPVSSCHKYCSEECLETGRDSWYLKRTYGITRQDYEDMLKAQENCCKICGSEGFLMKEHHRMKLVVDHCHDSGKVRGLLCHNCNRALGLMKDSVHTLESAIDYLEKTGTAKI